MSRGHPPGKHERLVCAHCGRVIASRVPRGGDGSLLIPYLHSDGRSRCIGSFQSGRPIAREEKVEARP